MTPAAARAEEQDPPPSPPPPPPPPPPPRPEPFETERIEEGDTEGRQALLPSESGAAELEAAVRWVAGDGPCNRCTSEIAAGTRSPDAQCHAFAPAAEGGSVCQTCSHSWHDHN